MKEHPTYRGYFVTEDGRVFSAWRLHYRTWLIDYDRDLKELKQRDVGKGYQAVQLKNQCKKVHRLVAETYIPNPNNLPQVNHIDENKENNCVSNLEWCSNQYNAEYSKSKWYEIDTPEGNTIEIFNLNKFCRKYHLSLGNLLSRGKTKGFVCRSINNPKGHH
jgi:hypothetical protein